MNSELTNNGQPKVGLYLIGEAWQLAKEQWAVWAPVLLIMGVINGAIQHFLMPASAFTQTTANGITITRMPIAGMPPTMPIPAQGGQFHLYQLISFLVSVFFTAGMFKMAIKQVRGEPIAIGDAFSAGNVYFSVLIVSILMYLAIAVGLFLLIVPGLMAIGGLCLAIPLVVDKNTPPLDALKLSWETLKGKSLAAFGVLFVSVLASLLGIIACCVGIFVTFPITLLTPTLIYRNYFMQDAVPYVGIPESPEPPIPSPL